MNTPAGWLIGIGVLLMLVIRRHITVVMVATVSLLAFVELGPLGLVMLWPVLLALVTVRRNSPPRGTTTTLRSPAVRGR